MENVVHVMTGFMVVLHALIMEMEYHVLVATQDCILIMESVQFVDLIVKHALPIMIVQLAILDSLSILIITYVSKVVLKIYSTSKLENVPPVVLGLVIVNPAMIMV